MSASTGIGGLIVGMAMLAVFVMFVGTLDARLSTHLSVTEQDDPPPDVSFVDANVDLNGLVEISITTIGSGYSVGDDVLDGTTVVGTVTEVDSSGGLLAVSVAMEGNRDLPHPQPSPSALLAVQAEPSLPSQAVLCTPT